ncbi:SCO family protein [Hydrogenobacter thermophilus]|uniref:SCO family protein n=1 Tax=Hydrogenobacter thermophilus TaxID=940 RepID=UPI0030FBBFB7
MLILALLLLWVYAFSMPGMREIPSYFDASLMRIDESKYLGNYVPDVTFMDEKGRSHSLLRFIKGKPTALILAYYTCDSACPILVKGTLDATKNLDKDFRVLVLSFDREDTLNSLRAFKLKLGNVPKNWTFGIMKGEDIKKLTSSIGYRFFYSHKDKVFVHPNVITFLSPKGEIVRYLYGISPKERDVRLAIAEAEGSKITRNSFVDLAFLVCYRYDPNTGKYGLNPTVYFGLAGFTLVSLTLAYAFLKPKREVKT